jgi:tRNA modification GTPase
LLGFERAIVSAQPGTTRDVVEETVLLRGWSLRLIDTAGLRDTEDPVEREGIARARQQRVRADLLLHVEDASQPPSDAPQEGEEGLLRLNVLNKIDCGENALRQGQPGVRISCATGAGMEALQAAIEGLLESVLPTAGADSSSSFVAINARHQNCLRRARDCVKTARENLFNSMSPEFVAEELRGALSAVGDIVGRVDTEDLLGEIFATFCIGK